MPHENLTVGDLYGMLIAYDGGVILCENLTVNDLRRVLFMHGDKTPLSSIPNLPDEIFDVLFENQKAVDLFKQHSEEYGIMGCTFSDMCKAAKKMTEKVFCNTPYVVLVCMTMGIFPEPMICRIVPDGYREIYSSHNVSPFTVQLYTHYSENAVYEAEEDW